MATSLSTTAGVRSTKAEQATDWRIWVPCVGMALCSLLSFIDRQVLAVLSPTILKDTGLTAADFGNVVFFFFIAYTVANPIWGSIIDRIGVRIGMILAVSLWSLASGAHAFMASALGFSAARFVLGLGEGATFPGSLRTATESLPPHLLGRGAAVSFSGGTIGAIITPIFIVPFGLKYGWRAAFILSGVIGFAWVALWTTIARPPYLPETQKPAKIGWPNLFERRVWALAFSYGPTAISVGPILTFVALYLNRGLGVSQAEIGRIFWMPPFGWALGYFAGGWAADRYASDNPRPVGLMLLCTLLALPLGFTARSSSVAIALGLISFSAFMAGVFQMVALKVAAQSFPREKTAMMSGIASGTWSVLNAALSPTIGRLFNQNRYDEAFWIVALFPVIGTAGWLLLSRRSATSARSLSPSPTTVS
jgi:ACS family hexuronate transporter-like MFS transporter